MVDVLLVLLLFFIVTWNFALSENELDVKIPSAANATDSQSYVGQVIVNLKSDGTMVVNKKPKSAAQLRELLSELAKNQADQSVMLRADAHVEYKYVVAFLDVCRAATIWNVNFATAKTQQ